MSEWKTRLPGGARVLLGLAGASVLFQWWIVPILSEEFAETWLWAYAPARSFPGWFRLAFPIAAAAVAGSVFARRTPTSPSRFVQAPDALVIFALLGAAGVLFWILRIRTLELGDARLILDHFISLETYASVREPLESILHTDFARLLFFGWGVHPQTGFQIHSCLAGIVALGVGLWGLNRAGGEMKPHRTWIGCIFLIGPVHLFFGYIEWYTQLAAGILVFQIFSILHWKTGRGLWVGLWGLIFAVCSHLVGAALVPAALFLIFATRHGARRWVEPALFLAALGACLSLTLWWIRRGIQFDASVEATTDLFATLLPLMREDNPSNPPGSWTYAWLSANHLADLANEILLCGLFSILLLAGIQLEGRRARRSMDTAMKRFFGLQLAACGAFLLIWNPWLGFPADWDLFSFFAWPLLAFSLFRLGHFGDGDRRRKLLWIAALPAFSIVFAWVVHHHQPNWMTLPELRATLTGDRADFRLDQARRARDRGDWETAFARSEEVLRNDPGRRSEAFEVFDSVAIQRFSESWADPKTLIPLAVDFEIMSASPMTRFLVLDVWGRLFFQEGGRFNAWSIHGLPGIPERRAVDFEIVPWRGAAVILRDDGALYEVPVSSWVSPNPSFPRETHFIEPPIDREPKFIGNFYTDFCSTPLGRGQRAVDLTLDYWNERLVVLDTTGRLLGEGEGTDYDVFDRVALIRFDAEVNYNGEFVFTTDRFGKVTSWPGLHSSIDVLHPVGWPAVTDLELTRGGNDLYLLDGQGGVADYSRLDKALIDPARMNHFFPSGEPLDTAPYIFEPILYFIDLEILPGERSFYKMTTNFRIHYSEQKEE